MTGGLEMAYTDFLQLVQARQSDRSYDKERPVEPEKLERVLKLHVWRLQPATHNLGGLWSSQIRNWLKKPGKLLLAWE